LVSWAALLDRLNELVDDPPTRVALAGLTVFLIVSVAMLRWASQHYVGGTATSWKMTTWERFMEANERAAEERARELGETWRELDRAAER
jgi:hypothetical protein